MLLLPLLTELVRPYLERRLLKEPSAVELLIGSFQPFGQMLSAA